MKNKWFVVFGVFLVYGLTFMACDMDPKEEDNPFRGTWVSSEGYAVTFEESSWILPNFADGIGLKGTYTFTGNTAQLTYRDISNDNGQNWRPITPSEASYYLTNVTVSGNTLNWGGVRNYYKQ
jgi:hypothetical protein